MNTVQLPPRRLLFTPGPATTTEAVKAALLTEDMSPRDERFVEVIADIRRRLTSIVAEDKNYTTVTLSVSGTGAVESMLLAAGRQPGKLLIIDNGAYGARMARIAQCYQLDHTVFKASPLEGLDGGQLSEFIGKSGEKFRYLAVVHHETTTGLLNDLDVLATVARQHDMEILLDAMSSFAALPICMQEQRVALLACSSNKNIQGMAGVGFVIARRSLLDALQGTPANCFYLDIAAEYQALEETGQGRFTLPVQILSSLHKALDEFEAETLAGRFRRYKSNWQQMCLGIEALGLEPLVDPEWQSGLLLAVREPDWPGFDFSEMARFLKDRGIDVYPGKLPKVRYFRLCCVGDLHADDVATMLFEMGTYLKSCRSAANSLCSEEIR